MWYIVLTALVNKATAFLVVSIFLFGCAPDRVQLARGKADKLLQDISSSTPLKDFPSQYFPRDQVDYLLTGLKSYFDFKNRKGDFIGAQLEKNLSEVDKVSFSYRFELKCDTVLLVMSYRLTKNPELYQFAVKDPLR